MFRMSRNYVSKIRRVGSIFEIVFNFIEHFDIGCAFVIMLVDCATFINRRTCQNAANVKRKLYCYKIEFTKLNNASNKFNRRRFA